METFYRKSVVFGYQKRQFSVDMNSNRRKKKFIHSFQTCEDEVRSTRVTSGGITVDLWITDKSSIAMVLITFCDHFTIEERVILTQIT